MKDNNTKLYEGLAEVQSQELRTHVLMSCRASGITTQELAQIESNAEYRETYSALEWFIKPNLGLPPLMTKVPMRLGLDGRPPKAYLLTEFGAKVLRRLDPNAGRNILRFEDESAWSHRFVQAHIYTLARKVKLKADVEKVLNSNKIRCDVVIHHTTGLIHVEVEQDLSRNNLWRAVEKLQKWRDFAASVQHQIRLIFVFNPDEQDLDQLVENWEQARGQAEENKKVPKNLLIQYSTLADINAYGLEHIIGQATTLHATPRPQQEDSNSATVISKSVSISDDLAPLYGDFQACVRDVMSASTARDQLWSLLMLSKFIHEASFHEQSESLMYSAFPSRSVRLLKLYLEIPHNQPMTAEIKQALGWIQKRSGSTGLIMFRNHMTRIVWDIFLKHHGLSRGGGLNAVFNIPDFQDNRSDFWVNVSYFAIHSDLNKFWVNEYCKNLSWVLSALFTYSEELDLSQRPWRVVEKTFRKSKKKKARTSHE